MFRALLRVLAIGCVACCALSLGDDASGQSHSLLTTRQMTRQDSWTYIKPDPVPELKLHSFVTVIVDYRSQVISEADQQRRRQASLLGELTQWLRIDGLDLKPAPLSDGPLAVEGTLNARDKNQSDLETRDGMKFTITCEIVDIRPNGALVLDGQREVTNNEEHWMLQLSGLVRPEDVLPNNTVLSNTIAELRVSKKETGAVRDGYRRGWLLEIIDRYRPF